MASPAQILKAGSAGVWHIVRHTYSLALVLVLWEFAARSGLVRPLFLPSIGTVLDQFWVMLADGEIVSPLLVSLFRAFGGLVLAVFFGVLIGLIMARSKAANWALDPIISFAFPAPKIAFVPIFILWFGIDDLSKILMVAFTCVFPVIVATYHGAVAVSRTVIWSAEAMGTPNHKLLYRIILPAALPAIFSGVRVTVPVALIIAFTTEMIAGGGGVGAALMFAQRFFQTPTVFVYIVIMLMAGFFFDYALQILRPKLIAWDDKSHT